VLDRLPVRTWDEDSISDALRMLLTRAVAFHDGTGTAAIAPGPTRHGGGGISLASTETGGARGDIGVLATSSQAEGAERGNTGRVTSPSAVPPENPGSSQGQHCSSSEPGGSTPQRLLEVRPVPGTLECRDAACSILRNHQGPLLPLRTKKMLLRETFGDLLQVLWSEQKQRSSQEDREGGGRRKRGDEKLKGKGEEEDAGEGVGEEEEEVGEGEGGREGVEGDQSGQEAEGGGRSGVAGKRAALGGVRLGAAKASPTEAFDVSPSDAGVCVRKARGPDVDHSCHD